MNYFLTQFHLHRTNNDEFMQVHVLKSMAENIFNFEDNFVAIDHRVALYNDARMSTTNYVKQHTPDWMAA